MGRFLWGACALLGALRTTNGAPSLQDRKRNDDGSLAYAYYRHGTFNESTPVPTWGSNATTARVVTWPWSTYRIFDSTSDVTVSRYDVFFEGDDACHANLGGCPDACVRVGDGGAYFFTDSRLVTIADALDPVHGEIANFNESNVVAVRGGACISIRVRRMPSEGGRASVFLINSGTFAPEPVAAASANATEAHMRTGDVELHDNAQPYRARGTCGRPIWGPGDAPHYDNLDGPRIPALESHYHTRGAIYFAVNGSSTYDAGVAPLLGGELRFVNQGYFYGPETFPDASGVIAIHEPDPRWIVYYNATGGAGVADPPGPPFPDECPLACLDLTDTPMRCVLPGRGPKSLGRNLDDAR